MKTAYSKNLFEKTREWLINLPGILKISISAKDSVEEVKTQLMFLTLIIINIIGFPLLIVGSIQSIILTQYYITILYIVLYLPIFLVLIFRNKLSYRTTSIVIVICAYLIAISNFLSNGFNSVGFPILFAVLVFTTLFNEIKTGFIIIFISVVSILTSGYLFSKNIISLGILGEEIPTNPIYWTTSAATFFLIGSLIILSLGMFHKYLMVSIQNSNLQSSEINKLNIQLKTDIEKCKISEERYSQLHNVLELKVTNRTEELDKQIQKLNRTQKAMLYLVDDLNETSKELNLEREKLKISNTELEAFSYSVSHDLRTPLRSIDGFSQAILEDYNDKLDDQGRIYLDRIRSNAQNMSQLIDDLLNLARVTRTTLSLKKINLSEIANSILEGLCESDQQRKVEFKITPGLTVRADPSLMHIALLNLLGNAWKFTSKKALTIIEFGSVDSNGIKTYYVSDNGIGFSMKYVDKLFSTFQRLHPTGVFPGSGIGLATVDRIVKRHSGDVWAEGEAEDLEFGKEGKATFYFTLNNKRNR